MAAIEYSLQSFIVGLATAAADRVYPQPLPPGVTLPAISYQRIPSGDRVRSHSGGSGGLVMATIQLNAWGADYDTAKNLAGELVAGLESYKGVMGPYSVSCFVSGDQDLPDPETGWARSLVDLQIWYR